MDGFGSTSRRVALSAAIVIVAASSLGVAHRADAGQPSSYSQRSTERQVFSYFDLNSHPTIRVDRDLLAAVLDRLVVAGQATSPGGELSISLSVGPYSLSVGSDLAFESASSAKLIWTVAAVDEAGTDSLEHLAGPVFEYSDNGAAGRMIDVVGIDDVNAYTDDLGMDSTYLAAWLFGGGRFASDRSVRGESNTTSTRDLVLFLEQLSDGELLSQTETARVLEWMTLAPDDLGGATGYGGALANLLPPAVAAATMHKAGWLPPDCCSSPVDVIIAAGIVPLPDDSTFSVAVAASGGSAYDAQVAWVGQVTCALYSALVGVPSCDYSAALS